MPARTGRPWQRLKARIVRRDRGLCHLCGKPGATTADHLVPHSLGGTDDPSNLAAAHVDCNQRRGNRPVGVARDELRAVDHGWEW